jgi:hypothetical protein
MSSAAEAELGALFINAKTTVSMQQTLIKLGHPQPYTPMQTDNATAHALLTNKILPKALKAMDMHFHWLRCRDNQEQFHNYWRPGTQNLADYFTKHHPATHHKTLYVPQSSQLSTIWNTGNSSCHRWPSYQNNQKTTTFESPLSCHPPTLTRTAQTGGVDKHPTSQQMGKKKNKQCKSTQHCPKSQLLQNPLSNFFY